MTQHSAYRLTVPESFRGGVVFSSPHSGAYYPDHFLADSQLDAVTLRSSEDAFVDRLFSDAPALGAPLIAATMPRAYVDLNRAASEIDPAMVETVQRQPNNPRVAAGLGVIPRVVSEGRVIRSGKISLEAAKERIGRFHQPYHRRLSELMEAAKLRAGEAILYDCHSMPHEALRGYSWKGNDLPHIVLGDRFGSSCSAWVMKHAVAVFEAAGFKVACNTPFAGGYITQTYGQPQRGWHCLQIEIDRSLYMDERSIQPRPDLDILRARIGSVIADLIKNTDESYRIAAE